MRSPYHEKRSATTPFRGWNDRSIVTVVVMRVGIDGGVDGLRIDLAFKRFNDACRAFELPRGYDVRKAVVAEALNGRQQITSSARSIRSDTDLTRNTAWSLLEARAVGPA